jgi:hypothetical protein
MTRVLLLVLVLTIHAHGAGKQTFDTLMIRAVPNAPGIDSVFGTQGSSQIVRKLPRSAIAPDTANIALHLLHGVTPGTLPIALTNSTFGNSSISEYHDTEFVYGVADTIRDFFQRTTNPLSGQKWYNCPIVDGSVFRTYIDINAEGWAVSGALDAISIYDSIFLRNQYSRILGVGWTGFGVGVRVSVSDSGKNGYFFQANCKTSGYDTLYKRVNGEFIFIGRSATSASSNSINIWLIAKGDTIMGFNSIYSSTVPSVSIIDNSIATGSPAIWGRVASSEYAWWKGGSYTASSVVSIDSTTIIKNNTIFQKKVDLEKVDTTANPAFILTQKSYPSNEIKKIPYTTFQQGKFNVAAGTLIKSGTDSTAAPSHVIENGDTTKVTYAPAVSDTFINSGLSSAYWSSGCVVPNGNCYFFGEAGLGNYDVYMQTGGTSTLVDLNQTHTQWLGSTGNTNGDVYVASYNVNNSKYYVQKRTGGSGNFAIIDSNKSIQFLTSSPSGVIYGMGVNDTLYTCPLAGTSFTKYLYIHNGRRIHCTKNGDLYVDAGTLYKIPYGGSSLIQVAPPFANTVNCIGSDTSGNVFVSLQISFKTYRQIGGVGNFLLFQTHSALVAGFIGKINGDVYALKYQQLLIKTSESVKTILKVFGGNTELEGKLTIENTPVSTLTRLLGKKAAPDNTVYETSLTGMTIDTATHSKKPIASPATAADSNLLALHRADSTYRYLTREQLRVAVDSVRKASAAVIADTTKAQRLSIVTSGSGITVTRVADSFSVALYAPPSILSLTNTMATNYAGQTVTGLTVNWALGGATITSQTLTDVGSMNIADRTHAFTGLSLATDKYYTLAVTDGVTPTSASTWVYFYIAKFRDTTSASAPTEANIEAGTTQWVLQSAANRGLAAVSITGSGKYIYYAYPSAFGTVQINVNGFASTWNRTTVSVTNAYGDNRNYYVYTSPTTIVGTISLSAVAN